MSIYVDAAIHVWRGKKWCHMTADTEAELHDFAVNNLGLKRSWFQCPPKASMPHYDITESTRAIAIRKGAIELSPTEARQRFHDYLRANGKAKLADLFESKGGQS